MAEMLNEHDWRAWLMIASQSIETEIISFEFVAHL